MTIFQIKVVHTVIFWVLSVCVIYVLFSGVADRVTSWTYVAILLLLVESVVLVTFRWTCPLTLLAERQGAVRGEVADIFLPKWFANRIFPICGTLFGIAVILVAWRALG
jgi:hypothetical protein